MTELAAAIAGLAANRDRLAAAGAAAHQTAQAYSLDKYALVSLRFSIAPWNARGCRSGAAVWVVFGSPSSVCPAAGHRESAGEAERGGRSPDAQEVGRDAARRRPSGPSVAFRRSRRRRPRRRRSNRPSKAAVEPKLPSNSPIRRNRASCRSSCRPSAASVTSGERWRRSAIERYAKWELLVVEDGTENASGGDRPRFRRSPS